MLTGWALRLYVTGSVVWLAAYRFQPSGLKDVAFFVAAAGAIPAVGYGLTRVQRGKRSPWWLLLVALSVLSLGLAVRIGDEDNPVGLLLNAAGNLLVLAAAIAMILRSGRTDAGGVIDASIIGLSLGGVLCIGVFALGTPLDGAARINLFVVMFALSGVLGALVRIANVLTQPVAALWWLMLGLAFALVGNVVQAASTTPAAVDAARLLFMAAYTSVGAFGLHPSAPRLVRPGFVNREDSLTVGRLVFLGAAVAAVPIVVAALILVRLVTARDGMVLLVDAVLTTALVMVRIGRLSADRARSEWTLREQATVDALTGLPNRRIFLDRLTAELADQRHSAILFCDLDGFKAVNDEWGHPAGDELLGQVGARLASSVRREDTVSRFGGDEFVILLPGATTASVDVVVGRIRGAFEGPFRLSVGDLALGVSIGIAADARGTPDELLRAADARMYEAKRTRGPTPSTRVAS